MLKQCLAIAALCAASASLCAAATVEVSVDTNNTIPNVVANSIIADGGGADWTGIAIRVDLTSGGIHNGSPDSNFPQSAFWAVPGFETLEWDTWFGIPGDTTTSNVGTCAELGCGLSPIGDGPLIMAGQLINMVSINARTTDTAPVRVSNISLSADAQGTWRMINAFAGGVSVHTDGVVINGVMVPEPSALALLAVGGLALMNRAYKEQPTC